MDAEIAHFMLRVAKFEFYLVNSDIELAQTLAKNDFAVVTGINWSTLAQRIEAKHPFAEFDFAQSPLCIFKETAPQYLVINDNELKWDSDDPEINSWERLLTRSFAQLRNNIAHGNKAQMTAPFTHDRTAHFLKAGDALIDFIAQDVFDDPGWETPSTFS